MVFLSLCAYAITDSSVAFALAGSAVIAASWLLVERPGRGMPRWGINIGVLLASMLLFWELARPQEENLLRALAHFMMAILACKLFEKKSNRDYSQILTLSLLITVTGAIFSTSLLFGAVLALYLAIGLYAVLLFHLRTEFSAALGPAQPRGAPPASLKRDIRFISCAAMAVLLCVAGLTFIIFPRNKQRELLSNWALNRANPVSGFSEHMMFTDFGRIQQSSAIVMEVNIFQRNLATGKEVPLGSPNMDPYFRGTTFENYDPDTPQWTRAIHHEDTPPIDLRSGNRISLGADPMSYSHQWIATQRVSLYPTVGNTLFAENPAVTIQSADLREVLQSPHDGTLTSVGPIADRVRYEIDTPTLYQPETDSALTDDFLAMPAKQRIPAPVRKVAMEVAGDLLPIEIRAAVAAAGNPETTPGQDFQNTALLKKFVVENPMQTKKIADRIEAYLHDNYAYSLEIHTIDSSLDPVSDFIVNRKQVGGHCEYFAAAMVLMCESLAIPARMVTGYHGGDYNSIDNCYTVRQKNAHAWVEVLASRPEWKQKLGWIRFDPTPSIDSTPYDPDSWSVWFTELFQVVERNWLASIVSFDNSSREYLAGLILQPIRHGIDFARAFAAEQFSGENSTLAARLRQAGLLAALLAACSWLWLRHRQRRRSDVRAALRTVSRATRKRLIQDLAFLDELMRLLRRRGKRRKPTQTPREFVVETCQNVAVVKDDALWLVDRFYELRLGNGRLSPQLRAQIATRLTRIRKSC